MEYIVIEIWVKEGKIKIVNFCNPCNRLSIESLKELTGYLDRSLDSLYEVICCGDFNAHSTLWGSGNDENGMVMEELMESLSNND